MYLGDVGELESHLNNDWTAIFRDIKTMEDLHFHLLSYNHRLTAQQRLQEDDPFINDEILLHHQQIKAALATLQAVDAQQAQLRAKYEAAVVSFEEIIRLMGRVGVRLLETYQSSFDKCKSLDDELLDRHLKLKAALVAILSQKDSINLEDIITLVIAYSRSKLNRQVDRLTRIVHSLENGDYERTQSQYSFKNAQPATEKKPAPAPTSVEKPKVSAEKAKVSSVGRQERSPVWEQLKAQERARRAKQKVALRLVHGLYSTMDLARQQVIDDMCSNEREKAKRLYNDIFSRNRFNHTQIIAFEAHREHFHHKLALFQKTMQEESRKIAEALRKSSKRAKRQENSLNFSRMEIEESEEKAEEREKEESRKSKRYRIQSPRAKGKVNEHPLIMQCSQENFNHIKFEAANHSTYLRPARNKLPFLYSQNVTQSVGRAASDQRQSDPKHHNSERRSEKDDVLNQEALSRFEKMKREEKYLGQRAKMPLKNIEVRVDGVMRQDEGREVRNLKPNPMEYTFYVRRSNRFYDPAHNIIL